MSKKEKLINIILDIKNNNWIVSGHRPNGMTSQERKSLFRSHLVLTIPMLEDIIENYTILGN